MISLRDVNGWTEVDGSQLLLVQQDRVKLERTMVGEISATRGSLGASMLISLSWGRHQHQLQPKVAMVCADDARSCDVAWLCYQSSMLVYRHTGKLKCRVDFKYYGIYGTASTEKLCTVRYGTQRECSCVAVLYTAYTKFCVLSVYSTD